MILKNCLRMPGKPATLITGIDGSFSAVILMMAPAGNGDASSTVIRVLPLVRPAVILFFSLGQS